MANNRMRYDTSMPLLPALIALLLLAGCSHNAAWLHDYNAYLHNKGLRTPPAEKSFDHCHGYGCRLKTPVSLSAEDWRAIDRIFVPPPKDAAQERERIGRAVGAFETIVGDIDGTAEDIGGTFSKTGDRQLDCSDESTNTTVYLSLLDRRGHLKFHKIRKPQMRFAVFAGSFWPHLTAVMTERATGTEYAVDSWFEDNGRPAWVVPLRDWSRGWRPPAPGKRAAREKKH